MFLLGLIERAMVVQVGLEDLDTIPEDVWEHPFYGQVADGLAYALASTCREGGSPARWIGMSGRRREQAHRSRTRTSSGRWSEAPLGITSALTQLASPVR